MLLKIAWRNIWRNKLRSFVVIGSIAIGVWSLIFLLSFSNGIVKSYIRKSIETQTSHLQIHKKGFSQNEEIQFSIPNLESLDTQLEEIEDIKAFSNRSICRSMAATSHNSVGSRVIGVDPNREKKVTRIHEKIIEGTYFEQKGKNPILLSSSMAEKLKVGLKKKVILRFQDINGEIASAAFRVCGIYDTKNRLFDDLNLFVKQSDLNRLLGMKGASHEIAILLDSPEKAHKVKDKITDQINSELTVMTFDEISPEINLFNSQMKLSALIFTFIFMLGLVFGIINTMLMAVLERMTELGMLMAIGMNNVKVFLMINIETILLALISAPIGVLIGWLSVGYFKRVGLDLSHFSKGMQKFGISEVVYPETDYNLYILFIAAVFITAIIGSIYPAIKAIRLKPVEAIRKI